MPIVECCKIDLFLLFMAAWYKNSQNWRIIQSGYINIIFSLTTRNKHLSLWIINSLSCLIKLAFSWYLNYQAPNEILGVHPAPNCPNPRVQMGSCSMARTGSLWPSLQIFRSAYCHLGMSDDHKDLYRWSICWIGYHCYLGCLSRTHRCLSRRHCYPCRYAGRGRRLCTSRDYQ